MIYLADNAPTVKQNRLKRIDGATWTLFDTSHWRSIVAVSLALKKQGEAGDSRSVMIDEFEAKRTFRYFMDRLNELVYNKAFRRYGKRLRVIPVLEKGVFEDRWHYHLAIEPPAHVKYIWQFEHMIADCWSRMVWSFGGIEIRPDANKGWVEYLLKKSDQKTVFEDDFGCAFDAIDLDGLYNTP